MRQKFKSSPLPKKNFSKPVKQEERGSFEPAESPKPLTPKEAKVLDFLTDYFKSYGVSPSYQEVKEYFSLASYNSVQNYLKQLAKKNYIKVSPHQKRCIEIVNTSDFLKRKLAVFSPEVVSGDIDKKNIKFSKKAELFYGSESKLLQNSLKNHNEVLPSPLYELPFLGKVAAGKPIESKIVNETYAVPPHLVKKPESTFILEVQGESMIEEGINPKDLLLIQEQNHAKNGDIVVVSVDNEATVKRIYFSSHLIKDSSKLELRPSNKNMSSFVYPKNEVQIHGIVIGLIRKF
ncbi:MAG: transcriptional repressor LexA [Bdellovibrionaceae bacterium]|nr:transcriptional repressor LexA [Pseudobdellovibrionaceae bacterium]NUM57355.1 transcriptional repressor LexA [Pseudobdellovibrionaceae bacterium]